VRARDVAAVGGLGLLKAYAGSLPRLLATLVPEHVWDVTRFRRRPPGFWQRPGVQRAFLDSLRVKLGLAPHDHAAWYALTAARVVAVGGAALLAQHRNSLAVLLPALVPEHAWDVTRFSKRPRGYWSAPGAHRAFASELGVKLGIAAHDYAAWYRVDTRALLAVGGATLLARYHFSLSQLLRAVYPEHAWDVTRFPSKPRDYWQDPQRARSFLLAVAHALGHAPGDLDAWYAVTRRDLLRCGARALLKHFGDSPRALLTSVFAEHEWHPWRFQHYRGHVHALWEVRDPGSASPRLASPRLTSPRLASGRGRAARHGARGRAASRRECA
jgi:hypothetical protein